MIKKVSEGSLSFGIHYEVQKKVEHLRIIVSWAETVCTLTLFNLLDTLEPTFTLRSEGHISGGFTKFYEYMLTDLFNLL